MKVQVSCHGSALQTRSVSRQVAAPPPPLFSGTHHACERKRELQGFKKGWMKQGSLRVLGRERIERLHWKQQGLCSETAARLAGRQPPY
jgi:hypothetical protein